MPDYYLVATRHVDDGCTTGTHVTDADAIAKIEADPERAAHFVRVAGVAATTVAPVTHEGA